MCSGLFLNPCTLFYRKLYVSGVWENTCVYDFDFLGVITRYHVCLCVRVLANLLFVDRIEFFHPSVI